ncbi:hypothetical protein QFZ75_007882 [Streptomyces sp. V3I8]|uniref:DUF6545 domain-containing protein n=1 Tax=Streptomyces sp. V3I8 TaxID=3042279 RepID=UPI00278853EC|nr:DUF6545 domain-containing protein [Streptomyces sp. V3I8]MDQ1041380.1 hypothetical protein [Streptomyces sp. V3I8]
MTATPPDLVSFISVVPLSLEVLRRLPAAVRNSKSRSLWFFLLTLDATMALRISYVETFVDQATHLDDGTLLVKRILGLCTISLMLRWVSTVVPGRMDGKPEPLYRRLITSRLRRVVTALVILASIVLFPYTIRVPGESENVLFLQAGHLGGSMHLILFYSYQVFGTICAAAMFSSASRATHVSNAFVRGMKAMAVGCLFCTTYALLRIGYLVVRLFDKPFLGGDVFVEVASAFALSGFVLLTLFGVTVPLWERMSLRVRMHEAMNDLRPMWRTLTYAVPTVIYLNRREQWAVDHLLPRFPRLFRLIDRLYRHTSDVWNWRRLDHRLDRRVTEICDAAIHLRSYLPEELRNEATATARELGLPEYAVPAYMLHMAIYYKRSGSKPHSENPGCPILTPADDPLATTRIFLPICKTLRDPVVMGKFNRRSRVTA